MDLVALCVCIYLYSTGKGALVVTKFPKTLGAPQKLRIGAEELVVISRKLIVIKSMLKP